MKKKQETSYYCFTWWLTTRLICFYCDLALHAFSKSFLGRPIRNIQSYSFSSCSSTCKQTKLKINQPTVGIKPNVKENHYIRINKVVLQLYRGFSA